MHTAYNFIINTPLQKLGNTQEFLFMTKCWKVKDSNAELKHQILDFNAQFKHEELSLNFLCATQEWRTQVLGVCQWHSDFYPYLQLQTHHKIHMCIFWWADMNVTVAKICLQWNHVKPEKVKERNGFQESGLWMGRSFFIQNIQNVLRSMVNGLETTCTSLVHLEFWQISKRFFVQEIFLREN